MSTVENHIRRPWIAVLLSLLCTGLGHIYCGRFVKGLVLFAISFFFLPLLTVSAMVGVNTLVLLILAAGYGVVSAVYLYAVIDSHKTAKQSAQPYVLRDYNHSVVYILLILLQLPFTLGIAFEVRENILEAFVCPAPSMEPTLRIGDRFLVNKTAYASRSPERGDIVVFNSPENRRQRWVKRVIAIPGDTIAVRGDDVLVNGHKLEREPVNSGAAELCGYVPAGNVFEEQDGNVRYLVQLGTGKEDIGDFEETRVPPGMVFVLGDNRGESRDSRLVGLIPQADVLGEVQFLYWPARTWSRFGAINH